LKTIKQQISDFS
jgi:hypothetical protein